MSDATSRLLPVTGTFLLPIGLLHTYLGVRCINARVQTKTLLGRDSSKSLSSDPAVHATVSTSGATGEPIYSDPLLIASSMHTNFIENTPLALIFAAAVELNGGNRRWLTAVLSGFTLARVFHAYGIANGRPALKFRRAGHGGSIATILGLAGWALTLVRGYWEI